MKNLPNDLNNFFNDPSISNPRIDLFTIILLVRLGVLNLNNEYDDIIAEVLAAHTPFHASLSSYSIDRGIGRGTTRVRVALIEEFKTFARDNKWPVENKYKTVNTERILEFYPYELTDINAITKTDALIIMERYAAAAHKYVLDFTPAFDTAAASFVTRYNGASEGQEIAKGNIGSDRTEKNDGRYELNIALFRAYNFCKFKTYADYDMMHNLFPLETLYKHPHHEIAHYSGSLEALTTVNIAEALYDGTYYALFRNIGPTDQMVGLEATATTPVGSLLGLTVKAGRSKSFQIIKSGADGSHFLNVTNLNLTEIGSWKIDIYREG
jgi:hypothetical protein